MRWRHAMVFLIGVLAAATAGYAQTLTYEHGGAPLFSITYPSGWLLDLDFEDEAEEAGAGEKALRIVEARPNEDRKLWVGLWVVPGATTLEEGLSYIASLRQDLFTDLQVSAPRALEMRGMPARTIAGTARREGDQVEFRMALFEPRAGVIAAGLYVGVPEAWALYSRQIEEMIASLEPAG